MIYSYRAGSDHLGECSKLTGGHPQSRRRDIQGIRAFAVLAVIMDHLFHWPSGGFSGVDIFFVISGFLITSLLLREWDKTHHISFRGFYSRRIRRIVPAATFVLICTAVASHLIAPTAIAKSINADAVYAFLFVSNWHFVDVGTDYFQQDRPPSPLQHYWSLSIEEQFYFVWPWLLLGVVTLLAALKLQSKWERPAASAIMGVVVAVSFGYAAILSTQQPIVAYFSSFTRMWELGLGALLACVAPLFANLPGRIRTLLAWGGLAGMAASLFVITPASVWPAPTALLPVLSTATVIAASTGVEAERNWILTNPVAGYLGDISYSLYLWHFPLSC